MMLMKFYKICSVLEEFMTYLWLFCDVYDLASDDHVVMLLDFLYKPFCFIDFSTKIGDTINLQNEHQNSYLQKLTLQIYEQHTKKVIYIYICKSLNKSNKIKASPHVTTFYWLIIIPI